MSNTNQKKQNASNNLKLKHQLKILMNSNADRAFGQTLTINDGAAFGQYTGRKCQAEKG